MIYLLWEENEEILKRKREYNLSLPLYSYRDLTENILLDPTKSSEFLSFTDDYIFMLIREVLANEDQLKHIDPIVVKYAEMIIKAQPLAPVTYYETFDDKEEEPCFIQELKQDQSLLQRVCSKANVNIDDIIIPEPLKITLYKDNEDKLQVFDKNLKIIYNDISLSASSIISYLKNRKLIIYRVYTFNHSDVNYLKKVMSDEAVRFRFKGDL